MERRRFTREFKLEAVRLIKERGVSVAQASRDLSVHGTVLRNWVKAFADDLQHAFPGHGHIEKLAAPYHRLDCRPAGWTPSLSSSAAC
jgi:transposase